MKTIFLWTLLLAGGLEACSQNIRSDKVPALVSNALQTKFPGAMEVEWERKQQLFEAEFDAADTEYAALIDPAGEIIMYKKDILLTELPEGVAAAIRKDYAGYTLEDLERIDKNGEVLFQVELEKRHQELKRVFSADGSVTAALTYWD